MPPTATVSPRRVAPPNGVPAAIAPVAIDPVRIADPAALGLAGFSVVLLLLLPTLVPLPTKPNR